MKKRIFSILLALCLMLSLLPATALAGTGGTDTDWYTAGADEYTLYDSGDLLGLASLVNGGNTFAGKTVKLGADIDLPGVANWTPIGNGKRDDSSYAGSTFAGIFDGDGHKVSGLTITSSTASSPSEDDALGLFGVVNGGTVRNLKLDGVNINAASSELAGAAIGLMVGGATAESITVGGSVSAKRGNGGVVGRMLISGTIKNCVNNAAVSATAANVGGIVGAAYYTAANQTMTIEDCTNNGTVTSTSYCAGGIVGFSAAKISGCRNTAAVSGKGNGLGGIVGEQQNYGSITGCTNSGSVTNGDNGGYGNGGIVGWVRYNGANDAEHPYYTLKGVIEVKNNVNSGVVSGGHDAGGIVGRLFNAANVTGNENTAASLSATEFAAGIVGSFQIGETPIQGSEPSETIPQKTLNCSNNISSTAIEDITAKCVDQYAYDNTSGAQEGKIDNNSTDWAARIGTARYATLAAAIEAVPVGGTTATEIVMLRDVDDAHGISVPSGKNFIVDFAGHTYIVSKPGEGSKGTQTNGFQLLMGSTITFKNGKMAIASDNRDLTGEAAKRAIKMLIQNYCDLTLDNMEIDGSNLCVAQNPYVVSNNCGDVTIRDTIITAADDCWAFDVFASGNDKNYKAVKVTVINSTINGKIDVARSSADVAKTHTNTLVIESGTFNGDIQVTDHENSTVSISGGNFNGALNVSGNDNGTVSITGGTFAADPSAYAADGYCVSADGAVDKHDVSRTSAITTAPSYNREGVRTYYCAHCGEPVATSSVRQLVPSSPAHDVDVKNSANGSVSVNQDEAREGAIVTITASPAKGFALDSITVTDGDGNELDVTAIGGGKYTFIMPDGDVTIRAAFTDGTNTGFVDVPVDKYFYDAVNWAVENGITGGVDSTHFAPYASCTRGQLVTFLWRAAGKPAAEGTKGFSDVRTSSSFYQAILWAAENGIVGGYDDGTFQPGKAVTRANVAAILFRYAAANGMDAVTLQELVSSYDDASGVPGYALSAFNWALYTGVITGNNGSLLPQDTCTRAQIVTMLYRLLAE